MKATVWVGRGASFALTAGMVAMLALPGTANAAPVTYTLGDYILPAQMTNMNPFLTTGNYGPLFQYLYNPLFYFDPVTGSIVPELASSHGSWNAKRTTYTVHLHSGAKWSNGRSITASDVIYSYDVLKNPALDPYGLWSHLSGVSGSGDTVVFHLKSSFPDLINYLTTVYIVPKSQWSQAGNPATNRNLHPIGSGPFTFYAYHPGSNIVLKANPRSVIGRPHITYLNIEMYANAETVTLALERGSINTTEGTIAMPSLPTLMRNKTNHLQKFSGLSNFGVFMNTKAIGLSNVYVRRAIQAAIDQPALISKGELGGVFKANPGWLPTTFHPYVNASVYSTSKYRFSLARARADLRKAGYVRGANGIMQRHGHPLHFTYDEASGAPAQEKEASMIQGWLKQVGIATTPQLVTWPELASLASSGNYQLLQDGFTMPPDPVESMSAMFAGDETAPIGKATPGLNYTRLDNPRLNSILAQAAATTSRPLQITLLQEAQTLVANEAPVALMYNLGAHVVYSTAHFTGYSSKFPVDSAFSMISLRAK